MKKENRHFAVLGTVALQTAQVFTDAAKSMEALRNAEQEFLVVTKPRSIGPSTTTPFNAPPEMFYPIGSVDEKYKSPKEYGQSLQRKKKRR